MKKHLFWKIMAVLFFLWLCVWLWEGKGRYQIVNANIGGMLGELILELEL